MGVVEDTQDGWNYSLQNYLQAHSAWQAVFSAEQSFHLSDVNYPRLFCPLVKTRSFCAMPAPFIDIRAFLYGWKIYKLDNR